MKTFTIRRLRECVGRGSDCSEGDAHKQYMTVGFLMCPKGFERLTGLRLKPGEKVRVKLTRVKR